jgi:four helix bundle protein
MSGSYRDLRVWNEAMVLAREVYRATTRFPKHEFYGLTNQLRRASVSVPSNIAEGKGRRSDREFEHFLLHARGSLLEVDTQIELAGLLGYMSPEQVSAMIENTSRVARGLNALINSLTHSSACQHAND